MALARHAHVGFGIKALAPHRRRGAGKHAQGDIRLSCFEARSELSGIEWNGPESQALPCLLQMGHERRHHLYHSYLGDEHRELPGGRTNFFRPERPATPDIWIRTPGPDTDSRSLPADLLWLFLDQNDQSFSRLRELVFGQV